MSCTNSATCNQDWPYHQCTCLPFTGHSFIVFVCTRVSVHVCFWCSFAEFRELRLLLCYSVPYLFLTHSDLLSSIWCPLPSLWTNNNMALFCLYRLGVSYLFSFLLMFLSAFLPYCNTSMFILFTQCTCYIILMVFLSLTRFFSPYVRDPLPLILSTQLFKKICPWTSVCQWAFVCVSYLPEVMAINMTILHCCQWTTVFPACACLCQRVRRDRGKVCVRKSE